MANLLSTIWSALKSTPKLTEDIFDKDKGIVVQAGKFIGGLHFSEQEKSEVNLKLANDLLEHVKATNSENTVKSQTRREVAVKWINMQVYLILLTAICVPLAILFPEQGVPMFKMLSGLTVSWLVGGGTLSILTFFFGPYGYSTYIKPKIKGGK